MYFYTPNDLKISSKSASRFYALGVRTYSFILFARTPYRACVRANVVDLELDSLSHCILAVDKLDLISGSGSGGGGGGIRVGGSS